MGRTGHPAESPPAPLRAVDGSLRRSRLAPPLIGALAVAVTAASGVVIAERLATPLAQATTSLRDVSHAVVVSRLGAARPARDGMLVPPGSVVRTGRDGHATLVTRSRDVLLGAHAADQVVDGARQQLRTGTAVVDSVHGPGLRLDLAGDVLTVASGAATEAGRSVMVRVGSLQGAAVLQAPGGRRLVVPALHQAVATGDSLPVSTTPLQLSDSSSEATAAPLLVGDDEALRTLAHGIDSTEPAGLGTVDAAWRGDAVGVATPAVRSERALPVLIAMATPRSEGVLRTRLTRAATYRHAGASWGVVLHLLDGRSAAVLRAFDAVDSSPDGQLGAASAQTVASVTGGRRSAAGSRRSGGRPDRSGGGTRHRGGSSGNPRGGSPGQPPGGGSPVSVPPVPTPTPAPVQKLLKTVGGVVKGVVGLLPTPTPSPSGSSGGVTGLVGGLLGGD
jgi:hypothetical protein